MDTIFSTAGVHSRDSFECWHDVACKKIVMHDSEADCRQNFQAELQSGALAKIGLILFENSPMTISHTSRHAARGNDGELFVCRQAAGTSTFGQNGREAVMQPGDIALLDPRQAYAGRFSARSKLLVLKVPRHLLEARVGPTPGLTAYCVKPAEAENRLASDFLAMLPDHVGTLACDVKELVENQVLDLIGVSLAKARNGRQPALSSSRAYALMRVRAAIEARLTNPALTSAEIAAAAGISVRYANALLAEEDTSIVRLIHSRRLALCRRALADESQRHRLINEIAYSWGFSDMSYFGRKFKAAYGLLPSEYRSLAASGVWPEATAYSPDVATALKR
jgi:AraC family transcriptional regulator, positive regulator of tynA and feaB